MKIRCKSCF